MNDALKLENIRVSYPQRALFGNLTALFPSGKNILLAGANGSGKTTLLKIMAGLKTADSGNICYPDSNPEISYLGHNLQIYQELTVKENITFFAALKNIQISIAEILNYWKLSDVADYEVSQISRGQKMKTALAVTLLRNPDCIFLDEPTANLDDSSLKLLLDYLEKIKKISTKPVLIVLASHDISRLGNWAETLIALNDGALKTYNITAASAEILSIYSEIIR